ncbi:MAG: type II CRISPR RNA-guided endonuclease Cas9, partial [Treponema sp.]|nr:type II CRISPR RNA-guided endonuclease Cas9 [Treponema sp.]
RRMISRKSARMRAIRRLLADNGMACAMDTDSLHRQKGVYLPSPWDLRRSALERELEPHELARVLIHLARHRGFLSNSKKTGEAGDDGEDKDMKKMLAGMNELSRKAKEAGTSIGAYIATLDRKRNRSGVYDRTPSRLLLHDEVDAIFAAQRKFGSKLCTDSLCMQFKDLAFRQRPLKSVADLVGPCTLIPEQRRAPLFAPTTERFRLAQKLVDIRLNAGMNEEIALSPQQIKTILSLQTSKGVRSVTFKTIRSALKLPGDTTFWQLDYTKKGKDPEKNDVVTKTSSPSMRGSHTFFSILGEESFNRLFSLRLTPDQDENESLALDYLARVISENDDKDYIRSQFTRLPLAEKERELLTSALEKGLFRDFTRTLHLSLKAIEQILPVMIEEGNYVRGAQKIGFDVTKERAVDISDIRNPLVQHTFAEVRKQFNAICTAFNLVPGRVHIELLREVGKSAKDRSVIEKKIQDRTKIRQENLKSLAQLFGVEPEDISSTELLRFELWKQQQQICAYYALYGEKGRANVYTGEARNGVIPVDWLRDGANMLEIDHILPYSRSFDDSFQNKCLCLKSANQAKRERTPFEWLGADKETWQSFCQWVQIQPGLSLAKKNRLLMQDFTGDKEKRFIARNLVDSSYVSLAVKRWFQAEYESRGYLRNAEGRTIRRIFTRKGTMTDFLRKKWGLNFLKKDAYGNRIADDRHHAIDAIVLACTTESMAQRLSAIFKRHEETNEHLSITPPWEHFRENVTEIWKSLFVSRAPRYERSGSLHKETLYALRTERDNTGNTREVAYERTEIHDFAETILKDVNLQKNGAFFSRDLASHKLCEAIASRLKDAHRRKSEIIAIATWLMDISEEELKKKSTWPVLPDGQIIRKIREYHGSTSGMRIRRSGGKMALVDNATGSMAELRIFQKDGSNKFHFVPVYRWQIATGNIPARSFVKDAKTENDWLDVSSKNYRQILTFVQNSYVKILSKNKKFEGYYNAFDRNTGSITIQDKNTREQERVSSTTIIDLQMFIVDRLGQLCEVKYPKNDIKDIFEEKDIIMPQGERKKVIYQQQSLF